MLTRITARTRTLTAPHLPWALVSLALGGLALVVSHGDRGAIALLASSIGLGALYGLHAPRRPGSRGVTLALALALSCAPWEPLVQGSRRSQPLRHAPAKLDGA